MINNQKSFGNIIYTEILLHENKISDRNTFETNIQLNQNKILNNVQINTGLNTFETLININENRISDNIQISTGLNKQFLLLGDSLLFINNKFYTILI